jgi:membrane-associated protease RseP (regulator of RpoE activity)
VRLPRIDELDLNVFEFDYDLTFMIFFLDAGDRVYARYGGRVATNPDSRQSLAGLRYTMQSVLEMHRQEQKWLAPSPSAAPQSARERTGLAGGGCIHCHQVKEVLNRRSIAAGIPTRTLAWRYPPPENLGFDVELDRGNVVAKVEPQSPAAEVGLRPGDRLRQLGAVPVHSFGDILFALDKAPDSGDLDAAWSRSAQSMAGKLRLPERWRKTDYGWRRSIRPLVPYLPVFGEDLDVAERKALGLTETQLAFRQRAAIRPAAEKAGIRPGDIIVGFDDQMWDMRVRHLREYFQRQYLIGDRITLTVIRDGRTLRIPLVLPEE